MKKLLAVVIISILAINSAFSQTNDFRNFSWGNSREKIKNNEKATVFSQSQPDLLEYDDKLGSADFKVLYIFNENDHLISGIYIFSKVYKNPELYYYEYSKFLKLLIQKYGKPFNEKETWNIAALDFDKTNKKQAIADKILNLYAVWNTKKSSIKITLISIGNELPSMQIHYTSNLLSEFENPADLKDAFNKL